jgi:predicted PurR-regulated permease PerM
MSDPNSSATNEVVLSNRQIIDIGVQIAVGAVFVIASFRILAPFVTLIAWGGVLAIAVYPLFQKTERRLGGRRKLTVTLFVLTGIALVVVPVFMMSTSLYESAHDLSEQAEEGTLEVPPPPPKVKTWPVVGSRVHTFWTQAATNMQGVVKKYNEQMKGLIGGLVSAVAEAGSVVLQFVFSIIIAGVFLASAEACIDGLKVFSNRLFGPSRGAGFNDLAAKTVRSVATGVLGVAVIQALLSAVGMAVAGVPWIAAWCLAILLLAITQLPPIIILLPLALWVFGSATNHVIAWGFLIWAILVSASDAVLKPMLLGRGVRVPMIVILLGAIGGMVAKGIIGLFLGAVVLALAYELLTEWLQISAGKEFAGDPGGPGQEPLEQEGSVLAGPK